MSKFDRFEVLRDNVVIFTGETLDKCYNEYPTLATVDFGNKTTRGLWIREIAQ